MGELLTEHWEFLVAAWVAMNIVNGMPSPGKEGATATWGYKWAFSALQGITGAIPRLIMTVFPKFSFLLPGNSNGKTTEEKDK